MFILSTAFINYSVFWEIHHSAPALVKTQFILALLNLGVELGSRGEFSVKKHHQTRTKKRLSKWGLFDAIVYNLTPTKFK